MVPELLELMVTHEMPFDRYKGRQMANLPGPYLGWFAREGFPLGLLGRLLVLMYEIDHNDLKALLAPLRAKTPPRWRRRPWVPVLNPHVCGPARL